MKSIIGISLIFFSANLIAANLDKKLAEEYALYAMMASNAYLKEDRTYFPVEDLGWVKVDRKGRPTIRNSYTPSWFGQLFSNLQYDIWVNGNETIISFKGTDEKIDWITGNFSVGISIPYKSAKKHVKKYMKKNPDQHVVLTGHSLGGGLALSVSLWEGVDAYVFNTSPRVFDGLGNQTIPAIRKTIYQEGDILQKVREIHKKFNTKIPEEDIIQTHFNFNGVSNHRGDFLAEGILRCASENLLYANISRKIARKVECDF